MIKWGLFQGCKDDKSINVIQHINKMKDKNHIYDHLNRSRESI